MADAPSDADLRAALRSHAGIEQTARLCGWAGMITGAWPGAEVWVYGSVLAGKDYRDVDVDVALPSRQAYAALDPDTDAQPGAAARLGSAWDVLAAAFSALARATCDLPVEARLTWQPIEWGARAGQPRLLLNPRRPGWAGGAAGVS